MCMSVSVCVGGYGYVFVAQDPHSGKDYALKVLCIHNVLSVCVSIEVRWAFSTPNGQIEVHCCSICSTFAAVHPFRSHCFVRTL